MGDERLHFGADPVPSQARNALQYYNWFKESYFGAPVRLRQAPVPQKSVACGPVWPRLVLYGAYSRGEKVLVAIKQKYP